MSPYSVEILEQSNSNREIKILTKSPKKDFVKAITIAKNGRSGNVEVKETDHFHDRYLIIDDREVWICGPSLNFLGWKKPGVILKLNDASAISLLVHEFDTIWNTAVPIIL